MTKSENLICKFKWQEPTLINLTIRPKRAQGDCTNGSGNINSLCSYGNAAFGPSGSCEGGGAPA